MNKIGLYLHVPFCRKKCLYCDFYSLADPSDLGAYEKALCRDLAFWGQSLKKPSVETLYFGGGTPSLLGASELERILLAVREHFFLEKTAEITLEMNPESVTEEKLFSAKKNAVNRISLGMQSADDGELNSIGRLHRFSDTRMAVNLVKAAGIRNVSLDLMYGLPGQSLDSFRKSLEAALSLEPQHISFYCLTLSPEVPLYQKRDELPHEEAVREMYLFAHSFLEQAGFEHYEISNAALPGYRSRHNERYWTGRDYLGIGPGAHSLLRGERFQYAADLKKFILHSKPFDTIENRELLTPRDRLVEYVMLSLRRKEGLDLFDLTRLSDEAFAESCARKMASWEKHGLCRKTSAGFALTPEGFFVSNGIISELI